MDRYDEQFDDFDAEVACQLTEKVREQAARLTEMEKHRQMCEAKILELDPNYDFTFTPDRFKIQRPRSSLNNTKSTAISPEIPQPDSKMSISSMKQAYNQLYPLYAAARREIQTLEASLRKEVLAAEEARAYIDILKQAVSSKDGEKAGQVRPPKPNKISEIAISQQKKIIANLEAQVAEYKSLADQNQRENEELRQRQTAMEDDLAQGVEALQQAQEEISKAEEEKHALLEHVEDIQAKYTDLNRQQKDQKLELAQLQVDNEAIKNSELALQGKLELSENLVEKYSKDLAGKDEKLAEYVEQIKNQTECMITQQNSSTSSNQANVVLADKVKQLRTEIENLTSTNSNLQITVDRYKQKSKKRKLNITEQIVQTSQKEREIVAMEKEQIKMKKELETLKTANKAIEAHEERIQCLQEKVQGQTVKVKNLTKGAQKADTSQADLREQLDKERSESNVMYEKMIKNRKKIKILQTDLMTAQRTKASEAKVYQGRIEGLEERIRQIKQEEAKRNRIVLVEREKFDKSDKEIADIKDKLQEALQDKAIMIKRYDTINADFKNLSDSLSQQTREFNQTRQEYDHLRQENQKLAEQFGEIHRLQNENASLMYKSQEVDCLRRENWQIKDHVGEIHRLQDENSQLAHRLEDENSLLALKMEEMDYLRRENQQSTEQIRELQRQLSNPHQQAKLDHYDELIHACVRIIQFESRNALQAYELVLRGELREIMHRASNWQENDGLECLGFLENWLTITCNEVHVLSKEAVEYKEHYAKLKQKLARSRGEVDQLQTQATMNSENYPIDTHQLRELEDRLSFLNSQNADLKDSVHRLSALVPEVDVSHLIYEATNIQQKVHNEEKERAMALDHLDKLELHDRHHPDIPRIRQTIDDLDRKMRQSRSQLQSLNHEIDQVQQVPDQALKQRYDFDNSREGCVAQSGYYERLQNVKNYLSDIKRY